MPFFPRRHQIKSAAAISANGNSGSLPNLGRSANPTVVLLINVRSAPTGTTPTLTVTLQGSLDGTNFASIQATAAITAVGVTRLAIPNVLDPNLQVSWTVGGTTPVFSSVDIDLLMTSPDA